MSLLLVSTDWCQADCFGDCARSMYDTVFSICKSIPTIYYLERAYFCANKCK